MAKETLRYPGLNLDDAHPEAHKEAQSLLFGFWVFLMSDAILFGLAFATYVASLDALAGGPAPGEIFEMRNVFIETMLLLLSSFTFGMASIAMKYRERKGHLLGWLIVTLLLGIGFLRFEIIDFLGMFAEGATPMRSSYLSAFFGLVPLHGIHVTAGCLWIIALIGQIVRYGLDSRTKLGIMRLALFWHFLDIIWVGIFTVVYLSGMV